MDPYPRSAAELDEMANTLRRLNTGESPREKRRQIPHHPEQWHEQKQYGDQPPIPPLPRAPEDEQLFRASSYETGHSHGLVRPPSHGRASARKDSASSGGPLKRIPTSGSTTGLSLYPTPSKPPTRALPPLPPLAKSPAPPMPALPKSLRRTPSQASAGSEANSSHYSESSRTHSAHDRSSSNAPMLSPDLPPTPISPYHLAPEDHQPKLARKVQSAASVVNLDPWKVLATKNEKGIKDPAIYYFDVSTTATTLASKHGNKMIKVWSVGSGVVQSTIKISCYTTAQARSREYFVRSHAILSEPTTLMAIAAGFGDSLEIWDWAKKKRLQTIDKADRWAAVRSNIYESAWSPLVTYRGDTDCIDLYAATHDKKPFRRSHTIELRRAGLPVLPKYPELAFSSTSPLLVTASGPRPPRVGHPPPERETLLVAWEIQGHGGPVTNDSASTIVSSEPYRVVAPWQHTELDTALPSSLATYGSVAVSIWIPASYRAMPVPAARGGQGYNLQPVKVHSRYVLIWDFSANSTRTFRIPNAISCVSPDCRYVAYCDARGTDGGARGSLVILDATTGKQLWCWPDPEAGIMDSGPRRGFEQLERLGKVTELSFAADSGFLFVGDIDGNIGVYEIHEGHDKMEVRLK
ncbi:hypothetical protein B0T16DRAFT_379164 [Cercophora newfieldiana]|uniref:Uncharacterized protein n=1 Tax=Cercophora newfieldiana TaxID=92897 RepID=A0AA40CJL1_9PEZI|nr:hypothetical protein B0T16DRAFT_379164 [Cercophora newfieldiana]